MKQFRIAALLSAALNFLIFAPTTQAARTCTNNADVSGLYGFTASRSLFAPAALSAPGTTGSTGVPVTPPGTTSVTSSIPISALVGGAIGTAPFSTVGTVFVDGTGNLFASSSNTTTPLVSIGTYTVDTNCGITATINNAFASSTATSGSAGTVSATFQGRLVGNGNEIDLIQTGGSAGTGTMGTAAAAVGTGTVITLKRTIQFGGCTNANLSGAYGFVASGMTLGTLSTGTGGTGTGGTGTGGTGTGSTGTTNACTVPSQTPFNSVGQLVADGAGNLTGSFFQVLGVNSTNNSQVTGTYTVNLDCTGTGRFASSGGQATNFNFVLVNASGPTQSGNPGVSPIQEVDFVITDPGFTAMGKATQQ